MSEAAGAAWPRTNDAPSGPPPVQDGGQALLAWLGQMREERPVWPDPNGIHHVFRYDDVQRVLSDYRAFSSDISSLLPGGEVPGKGSLIATDPPEHHKLRRLISQAFTPRAVSNLTPRIAAMTERLLDDVDGDEFDFMERIAYPLPVLVIAELLGIPVEDVELFRGWAMRLMSTQAQDPTKADFGPDMRATLREMGEYMVAYVRERRSRPQDDFISRLIPAEVDGHRLTDAEIVNSSFLVLLAGQTPSTLVLGNALMCLEDSPDAMAELRADPGLIPAAFEEVLRFRPPVTQLTRRSTAETTLVDSEAVPAERMVIAWMLSANRDPRQFPEPDRFDIHRWPNRHLGFGTGAHLCLGAPLARLVGKIALNRLLQRFAELRRAPGGELSFHGLPTLGASRLPVRVRRAGRNRT